MPAAPLRAHNVVAQQLAVARISAVADDLHSTLARRQPAQIGQSMFGDDDVDVVFGMVPVSYTHLRAHET